MLLLLGIPPCRTGNGAADNVLSLKGTVINGIGGDDALPTIPLHIICEQEVVCPAGHERIAGTDAMVRTACSPASVPLSLRACPEDDWSVACLWTTTILSCACLPHTRSCVLLGGTVSLAMPCAVTAPRARTVALWG